MCNASLSSDMQRIIASHPDDQVVAAWQQLPAAQRSALLLLRAFPGSAIVHEFDHADPFQPE